MTRLSRTVRVLVGVHGGGFTGIDTYAEQLAVTAAEVAAEVVLLATTRPVAEALRRRVGSRVQVADLGLGPTTPRQARLFRLSPTAARRHLERGLAPALTRWAGGIDVVHLNHPPLATVARGTGGRVVVAGWFHPHAATGRMVETWRHTGRRLPRSAAMAVKALGHYRNDVRGYRAADCITTPTEELASALRRKGLPARRLVPPAAPPLQPPGAAETGDGGRGDRLRLVVCCGDLGHPRKNVAAALAAAGELAERGRPSLLTLVGRNAEALRRDIDRLPSGAEVVAVGSLPPADVAAQFRAADVLLLPSLFEEWGYVAVEAALQGTPVVAFPVYPFAEMLVPPVGRTAGSLAVGALADAVAKSMLRRAPRAEVAAAAAARFGAAAVAAELEALWSAIL